MRVLAAAFRDPASARRALRDLVERFPLAPDDVSVAPLGSSDHPGTPALLAGRFPDADIAAVRAMLGLAGGEIVSEVDERWTHSPAPHDSLEPEKSLLPDAAR